MKVVESGHEDFRKRLLGESLSERFGLALVAGDARAAEELAQEALELDLREAELYEFVVAPAMHRIGRMWAAGEISVAHEHLATRIATQVLVLAHELANLPGHRAGRRAVLAAVEGEHHVVALEMAGNLLDSAGYEVVSLGADVPTESLAAIVADHPPDVFLFSATSAEAAGRLPAAVSAVTVERSELGVIVGGAGISRGFALGPRVVIERSVIDVVDAADAMLRNAGLN